MTTVAVLAEDEDDALSWAVNNWHRHKGIWREVPVEELAREAQS